MKEKINTYFAVLIIAIAGAGVAMLIMHVANTKVPTSVSGGNELQYQNLQQSILQK